MGSFRASNIMYRPKLYFCVAGMTTCHRILRCIFRWAVVSPPYKWIRLIRREDNSVIVGIPHAVFHKKGAKTTTAKEISFAAVVIMPKIRKMLAYSCFLCYISICIAWVCSVLSEMWDKILFLFIT